MSGADQESSEYHTSSASESISRLWEIKDLSGRRQAIFVTALEDDIAIITTSAAYHMLITPKQSAELARVLAEIRHAAHTGD